MLLHDVEQCEAAAITTASVSLFHIIWNILTQAQHESISKIFGDLGTICAHQMETKSFLHRNCC